jgi:O-antigen ligase
MGACAIFMAWTAVRDFSTGNLAIQGVRIGGYDSPLAANPNDLALILNLILALLAGLYDATRRGVLRWCLLVVMGLSIAAVVVSFSRGGFLTLLAVGVAVLIKRTRERGPAAIGLTFLALLVLVPFLPPGYFERVSTIFEPSTDSTGSADARIGSMILAWSAIREHPLLGVGLQMHGLDFLDTLNSWNWSVVHNVFLQVGADLGLPALVMYVFAIWYLFLGIGRPVARLRRVPEARELVAMATGIRIALVAFCVGGFFHPVAYHFYLYYVAGLAVACSELAKRFEGPAPGRGNGRPISAEGGAARPSAFGASRFQG